MIDPDYKEPVVVNDNTTPALLRVLTRSALLLVLASPLAVTFLSPEQIAFLKSDTFLAALSGAFTALTVLWGLLETLFNRKNLVAAATAAPNKDFTVETISTLQTIFQLFKKK